MAHEPRSLPGQLAELKRERAVRGHVYPKLIAAGRLDQRTAERQNDALEAAIATLQVVADAYAQRRDGKEPGQ